MTTPDDPDEQPQEPTSYPPLPAVSLSDRLAQLEPDDDEPLFDDPYDDTGYDGPYDDAGYEAATYADPVPTYEPAPAYDPAPAEEPSIELAPDQPVDAEPPVSYEPPAAYEQPAEAATAYDDSAFAAADEDAPATAPAHDALAAADRDDAPPVPVDDVAVDEDATAYDDSAFGKDAGPGYETVVMGAAAAAAAHTVAGVPTVAAPTVLPPEAAADEGAAKRSRRDRRRKRSRPPLAVLALALMTLLTAVATGYLWLEVRERSQTEQARRAGLEASRDAARLLFSYDYRTLEKDFATGRALTTGDFRKQYESTTTKVVSDVAKQYKAVVKANVVSAGIVRATPSTVVSVVYVNQVTTSTRVQGEKVDLSRVRMTLRKAGDRWLVERVQAL